MSDRCVISSAIAPAVFPVLPRPAYIARHAVHHLVVVLAGALTPVGVPGATLPHGSVALARLGDSSERAATAHTRVRDGAAAFRPRAKLGIVSGKGYAEHGHKCRCCFQRADGEEVSRSSEPRIRRPLRVEDEPLRSRIVGAAWW